MTKSPSGNNADGAASRKRPSSSKSAASPKRGKPPAKKRTKGGKKPSSPRQQKRPSKRPSGPEGFAAREAAVVLLHNVLNERRPLDDILMQADKVPQLAHLSTADRGFARAIAATALRRNGQLQEVLDQFLEKGLPARAGHLREILLAAATQLLFLNSPPHAVLNIAVQQVKRDRHAKRFDKLTNAVLRRVSEKGPALIAKQDAGRLNTPGWLWNSWCRAYDKDTARRIGEAHLTQAQLDLTIKFEAAKWAKILKGELLPTGSIRLDHKGRIENIAGFEDGAWWVQDMAAALPVKLLGKVKGKSIADLAAAPGGKTAQLAALGAEVVAVDGSARRLRRLQENMERLELECEIVRANILEWDPRETFDAVLLDAPCTATGTIRRHPDLPFLKKPGDIEELSNIQSAMLDQAVKRVKRGGTLIYCTCSLQKEEGEEQIDALLQRNHKIKLDPIRAEEFGGSPDWITRRGFLRTLPFHAPGKDMPPGMDGFFAARLKM